MLFDRHPKPAPRGEEGRAGEQRTTTAHAASIWHGLEQALDSREPSNSELAAALRQAAEYGALPPARIRAAIARRIEETEMALLRVGQELMGDVPSRA